MCKPSVKIRCTVLHEMFVSSESWSKFHAHPLFLVVGHLANRQRVKTGTHTTEHH
jgi:hypothetical protein